MFDDLMKQRKYYQLALSIVHDPYNDVVHNRDKVFIDNYDKARLINLVLFLMKANKGLKYFPALSFFPVKTTHSKWNFHPCGRELQFFSLQDLGNLAQVNREFYENFKLITKDDGINILINANKKAADQARAIDAAINIQKIVRGRRVRIKKD
tara:strand:+ start:73 stop:531 length:459 start_codon:yes stop_codon:yes gene_type:complete